MACLWAGSRAVGNSCHPAIAASGDTRWRGRPHVAVQAKRELQPSSLGLGSPGFRTLQPPPAQAPLRGLALPSDGHRPLCRPPPRPGTDP